jgi:hypothetical protein
MEDGTSVGAFVEKPTLATFGERFCARHSVAPGKYEETVLRRSLYPTARVLQPILMLKANHFAADREFIRGVGRLTRFSSFDSEAQDYLYHPNNRGFLRRVLRLRVSIRRLSRMVQEAFHESQARDDIGSD